jgi:hypothetical protein
MSRRRKGVQGVSHFVGWFLRSRLLVGWLLRKGGVRGDSERSLKAPLNLSIYLSIARSLSRALSLSSLALSLFL